MTMISLTKLYPSVEWSIGTLWSWMGVASVRVKSFWCTSMLKTMLLQRHYLVDLVVYASSTKHGIMYTNTWNNCTRRNFFTTFKVAHFYVSSKDKGGHNMTWPIRVNIWLRVAVGLQYLHEIAQPRIIHRDIKASNILLDKISHTKIVDFSLAMLFCR